MTETGAQNSFSMWEDSSWGSSLKNSMSGSRFVRDRASAYSVLILRKFSAHSDSVAWPLSF